MPSALLAALTSVLALVFAVALIDQWRERRHAFQLIWAIGMLLYGLGAGFEAIGETMGWNGGLVRGWFVTGVATPAWLGFLVLTIAGERLELSRFMPPSRRAKIFFAGICTLLLLAIPLAILTPQPGWKGRFAAKREQLETATGQNERVGK